MSDRKVENLSENVRIDKWLWAARFFKTRSVARDMVQAGKVHYNGQRVKAGKIVELGAMIKIPAGWDTKEVVVKKITDKRQGAPLAQQLYEETVQSIAQREDNQTARKLSGFHSPKPDGKPDKKQRRQIIKFKHQ
ncbi:ribosome-associated heat shock protein Hsp15 [Alteromonas ponticola]|uniref:Heat shock protein 15 n=1 Tax=Alteromonas aquimaris TaxID=2998417 RepID=A0ABT3P8G8_9ALTE|nr:ribosome-associated heat shock protein Hsp15 [Alteromonas aquimaris]MCW8109053.1 ribosome-associated heat shock protein Hsp15 [Alteromonas aquimaris]